MKDSRGENTIEQFEQFLNKIIFFEGDTGLGDSTAVKADVLERMLESWRFNKGHDKNGIPLSYFLSLERVLLPSGIMSIRRGPDNRVWMVAPLSPKELQLPLLLFLLVQDKGKLSVLPIIEQLIAEIRPKLSPFDMEKTKTGVTRCFTNTRFAAKVLRDYGLLRFTRVEAFKTWKLSFLGLIVAGLAYYPNWRGMIDKSRDNRYQYPSQLSFGIQRSLDAINDPDVFIKVAESLYDSSATPFSNAMQSLKTVHSLINRFIEKARQKGVKVINKKKIIAEAGEAIEAYKPTRGFITNIKRSFEMTDFSKRIWGFIDFERGQQHGKKMN